jgi:hypothetical protein
MKFGSRQTIHYALGTMIVCLLGVVLAHSQSGQPGAEQKSQMAEDVFKNNIQVLRAVVEQTPVSRTRQALSSMFFLEPAQNREVPKMPEPAGPAPKRDMNGAWVGPLKASHGDIPPMTPMGEARFKLNKPAVTNDPFVYCDPLGFPRSVLNHPVINAGMWFEHVPNRIVMLYQSQRVWRDIWMDGRELPKKVDAKGAPDSRFYGYSVGHWDGDYTLVIDTTGVDDRTWLDEAGHPHTVDMHVQERYTRLDEYTVQLTVTVDDPKFYTKPFEFLKATYQWMVKQDFEETFCVPSEGIEYRDSLAKPAGTGDEPAQ